MKMRVLLAGSAAVAALAFGVPEISGNAFLTPAQAATSVSISINTFYRDLAPHGDWVRYHDAYVFVPVRVRDGWRPYTVGHWVYTREYGWYWVSTEPFGWATYHYGRWGYADDIGWYWVPGTKWAPAWVSWRRSNDYVAWAPLPPSRHGNVVVDVSFGDVPDYYWTPVPARDFLDVNLSVVIVHDRGERERIVRNAEPVGAVTVQNNIVVNNVIDVDFVRKETKKDVKAVEVKESDKPQNAERGKDSVTVFKGDVQAEADAKPAEAKDAKEVQKIQEKRKNKPTENAGEGSNASEGNTATQPAEGQGNADQHKTGDQSTKKPGQTGEQPSSKAGEKPSSGQPSSQEGSSDQAPPDHKSKKNGGSADKEMKGTTPNEPTQGEGSDSQKNGERSKEKKKPDAESKAGDQVQPEDQSQQNGGETKGNGRHKKPTFDEARPTDQSEPAQTGEPPARQKDGKPEKQHDQPAASGGDGSAPAHNENGKSHKQDGKPAGKEKCDPASDPSCAAD